MPVSLKLVYHFRAHCRWGQDRTKSGMGGISLSIPILTPYFLKQATTGVLLLKDPAITHQIQQEESERTTVSFSILIEKGKWGRCWKDPWCQISITYSWPDTNKFTMILWIILLKVKCVFLCCTQHQTKPLSFCFRGWN